MKILSTFILTAVFIIFSVDIETKENVIPVKVDLNVKEAIASGCTICETGTEECHRIIIGNEVRIYFGKAKDCPGDVE
ncbi:MAG: hypothetical protein WD357_08635 [Gracilimonas sp.]